MHAGVSRAAVSLALREHPKSRSFSPETIRKIRRSAQALGYRVNLFSGRPGKQNTKVFMLYLSSLQDLYSGAIAESFQERAFERGYWTMLSLPPAGQGSFFDERVVGEHGIAAVALIGQVVSRVPAGELRSLAKNGGHVVTVGRNRPVDEVCGVLVDDRIGLTALGDHIYGRGARQIWLVGSHAANGSPGRTRCQLVAEYAREHGFPEPVCIDDAPRESKEALTIDQKACQAVRRQLAAGGPLPDAIVADLDIRAMGVYYALREKGLEPGRDVAVTGYDDIWPSQAIFPSLTTVHQPTREMGIATADMLADALERNIGSGRQISIQPELRIRESTTLWEGRAATGQ